ncbi:hypothetical protein GGF37_007129, partial [Kickxella alabastrina]
LPSMQPLALSSKHRGGSPSRVERTYRVADRTRGSDIEDATKQSEMDEDLSPSPSPMSAVFTIPALQQPPPPMDLPPLPAKLQQQLKQLPRLSPPRKLILANNPGLQLGLPEPGLPMSPAVLSQISNRRVISGSSLLRSPSKATFADNLASQNMHV